MLHNCKKCSLEELVKKKNVDSINSVDYSFYENGHICSKISIFTELQKLTLKHLQLDNVEGIETLKLKYLDVSNNLITSVDSIKKMETLTYLDVENNQLETVPILTQLLSLNIADNFLVDDKSSFMNLRQMTNLTSLTINPSTVKSRTSLEELNCCLEETIQFESQKKKEPANLKMLKAQKHFIEKVLECNNPMARYSNVYIRLLLVLLPKIQLFNSKPIDFSTKNQLNESVIGTFQFYKEMNCITQIEKRKIDNRRNLSFGPISQFSNSSFEKLFDSIPNPRQIDFSKVIPGKVAIATKNGGVYFGCIQTGQIKECESLFDSLIFGLCWGNSINESSKLIVGSLDGIVSLYDTDFINHPIKTIDNLERVSSMSINSDCSKFIISGYENNIFVYNFERMTINRVIGGFHNDIINSVKFSNQTPFLLSACCYDHLATCWDLRTPCSTPIFKFYGQTPLTSTSYSADDGSILIAGEDNYVVDIDLRLNKPKTMKAERSWQTSNSTRAIYSNDNDSILSIDSGDTIHFYDRFTTKRKLDFYYDASLVKDSIEGGFVSIKSDPFNDGEYYAIRVNRETGEKKYSFLKFVTTN